MSKNDRLWRMASNARRSSGERGLHGPFLKPATHHESLGEAAYNNINFPILGIIDTLYFSDDPRNKSNSIANPKSTNVAFNELLAKNTEEWYRQTIATTLHTGNRLEARIKVVLGPDGHMDSGTYIENVPICIGFGGTQNYGYVVPSPTSNTGRTGYRGTENGDYCLVQFIGGNWSTPVVTNTWPSPLNTADPPMVREDVFAYAKMAGTEVVINKQGDFVLDARNANEEVRVNPKDGVITKKPAQGNEGMVTLATRSDIYIAAGFPRDNEGSASLPAGTAVLRASKDVEVFSTVNSVKIYSPAEVTDQDGNVLNRVDIQGPRGSLRKAARQYDRVKITSGDSGDLFDYIESMRTAISGAAAALEGSLDPGANAAGIILTTFVNNKPPPTYQYGKITTGSDYCHIAGVGDASDIGFDESGIKDALGNPISPEKLHELQVACAGTAVGDYAAQVLLNQSQGPAFGGIALGLKSAEKVLEKIPVTKPAAEAIKAGTPLLMALLMSGGIDDTDAWMDAADATAGPGKTIEILDSIKSGEKTSWDWYNSGLSPSGEYEGPEIPINPKREATKPNQDNNPPTNPDLVDDAGWWYEQADLDTPGSPFYEADAYTKAQDELVLAGDDIKAMLDNLMANFELQDFNMAAAAAVAIASAAAEPDIEVAVEELDELTGGSISESVNECADEKIPTL
jgi:hypothetical protein